jgi:hypothetical protein
MSEELRFQSAVGWSFKIPALFVAALLIVSQSKGLEPVSLLVLGCSVALMRWLYVSTVYTVTDSALRVQSGPLHQSIDARLIERVRPTRTILSAPALSLDRLEIAGGFGAVVVSPREKAAFIRALQRIAPQLRLEGGLEALTAD